MTFIIILHLLLQFPSKQPNTILIYRY